MKYMCKEERIRFLDALPLGSILYFSGHEMLYLGKEDGKYYVISSVGTIMRPEDPTVRQRIRGIVINTLDVRRANGNTWLNDLTTALIPYQTMEEAQFPANEAYHDALAYCLKNGYMELNSEGEFQPNLSLTWAEWLRIVANMEKATLSTEGLWYEAVIAWAKENEVITTAEEGYLPATTITGEQAIMVLYRNAQRQGYDMTIGQETNILSYEDVFELSSDALVAVQWAVAANVIDGDVPSLNLTQTATRAQIAEMVYRYRCYIEQIQTTTVTQ